jgi:hypothetical protein
VSSSLPLWLLFTASIVIVLIAVLAHFADRLRIGVALGLLGQAGLLWAVLAMIREVSPD